MHFYRPFFSGKGARFYGIFFSRFVFLFLLSFSLLLRAEEVSSSSRLPENVDRLVLKAMEAFETPGIALAVVKDGQGLLVKGYGTRKKGGDEPVDAHTLFGIASNTKVFTAVALGMLVEQGKLAWDAPVIDYLPSFQMWDPYVTREMTLRDLLVHRSGLGLGGGDLLWWPSSTFTRQEILRRLRFLRPATSFRSHYAYDNVLYIVAGEVLEAVTAQSWEDFVGRNILQRVGMQWSNVRHSDAGRGGNIALPHARVNGSVGSIRPFLSDTTNAAGGINTCAEDMAKWMATLLQKGRLPDGSRLYSEQTAREISTIVTPVPDREPPPELSAAASHFTGYALGLQVRTYRGQKVVTHTGTLPGYVSQVWLLPEKNLGIAILTNQESRELYQALTYQLTDFFLPVTDPRDWTELLQKVLRQQESEALHVRSRVESSRNRSSRPSLPLDGYVGRYRDDWYGEIEIFQENGGLVIRFSRTPALIGDLEHWQYDTFLVRWRDRELRADAYLTFALRPDGKVDQARMQAVSADTDFSYDFQDLLLKMTR